MTTHDPVRPARVDRSPTTNMSTVTEKYRTAPLVVDASDTFTMYRFQVHSFRIFLVQIIHIAVLLVTLSCGHGSSPSMRDATTTGGRVANLRAFARLYGMVRWFHPADAASAIDWDRFAIEGAHRTADARDTRALRAALVDLFKEVAPTVHIVGAGEQFPFEPALHPRSTLGLEVVAWQHKGFGDSSVAAGGYISKRRHRGRTVPVPGALFAALSQAVDAAPYRGNRVRLRGRLRTAKHAQGRMWLRVDRSSGKHGFFDNMARHPVMSASWAKAEITGTVDADATKIIFGTVMFGSGTSWYDDFELSVQGTDGTWKVVPIPSSDFETQDAIESWTPGTGRGGSLEGWSATLDREMPASGVASLRIEAATKILTEELFKDAPAPGETVDVELGSGLRARVPIALYSRGNRTIGDTAKLASKAHAAGRSATAGFDAISGAADVIVVWNVLEHFWPYWDVVSDDWDAALDAAIADALDDRSVMDHVTTLKRLTTAAPDGHASTSCPGEAESASTPFAIDLVEGQVVVTASADEAIARGDVVLSVNGVPAAQLLAEEEALVSGSPQWKTVRALHQFGGGPAGSKLSLRLRRGNSDLQITVSRTDREVSVERDRPPIERFSDGVYYVDLSRAPLADIEAVIDRLAAAPGVVFDLRGRPNANHQVLSYLFIRTDDANAWMAIPRVIRPGRPANPSSWETAGWNMPVLKPHIAGRVAFLTGPGAVSYPESVMALVEHYRLGEIVGAATAGTNGDIAMITSPTGCNTIFTGRRVTKPDGSRHHLVGVKPTIPASRTIAGVLAGRDEVLERALVYVRVGK